MKVPPVHFKFDKGFKLKQLSLRNVPIHYQFQVSKLLDYFRKKSVIKDVNPRGNYDCVRDVVLTDKKNSHIRMGVDNTPKIPISKHHKKFATNSRRQQRLAKSTWDGLFINCF